jgi:hypothetical protein
MALHSGSHSGSHHEYLTSLPNATINGVTSMPGMTSVTIPDVPVGKLSCDQKEVSSDKPINAVPPASNSTPPTSIPASPTTAVKYDKNKSRPSLIPHYAMVKCLTDETIKLLFECMTDISKLNKLAATLFTEYYDIEYKETKIPHIIIELGNIAEFGVKKYAEHNWRKGFKYSRLFDAAIRHYLFHKDGELLDPETGRYHIAHCLWNILALIEHVDFGLGENDLFVYDLNKKK